MSEGNFNRRSGRYKQRHNRALSAALVRSVNGSPRKEPIPPREPLPPLERGWHDTGRFGALSDFWPVPVKEG